MTTLARNLQSAMRDFIVSKTGVTPVTGVTGVSGYVSNSLKLQRLRQLRPNNEASPASVEGGVTAPVTRPSSEWEAVTGDYGALPERTTTAIAPGKVPTLYAIARNVCSFCKNRGRK